MSGLTTVTAALSGALRHDARVAEEFAGLLESGRTRPGSDLAPLVGLARALSPVEHLPEPTFRTALRARLMAQAVAGEPSLPAQRAPQRVAPAAPRWRRAAAAVALASTLTGVGAAAASSQALPGDTLYGVKLRVEAMQLFLTDSDLERGRELLDQAEARLGEAERLSADSSTSSMSRGNRDEMVSALTRLDESASAGAAAVLASYEETGDPESLLLLARSVDRLQPRLQELSTGLDRGLRARVQRTLDTLATLSTGADAVLPPMATRAGEAAGRPGRARADAWDADRSARFFARGALPPSAATGSGRPAAGSDGSSRSAVVTEEVGPLPVQAVPVPSVAAVPLPTVTTSEPETPGLPATPSACVAVPPLTTC